MISHKRLTSIATCLHMLDEFNEPSYVCIEKKMHVSVQWFMPHLSIRILWKSRLWFFPKSRWQTSKQIAPHNFLVEVITWNAGNSQNQQLLVLYYSLRENIHTVPVCVSFHSGAPYARWFTSQHPQLVSRKKKGRHSQFHHSAVFVLCVFTAPWQRYGEDAWPLSFATLLQSIKGEVDRVQFVIPFLLICRLERRVDWLSGYQCLWPADILASVGKT